jgi:predicted dehydrogenase
MPQASAPVLAVVGGGRWARVYLSVLAAMPLPFRLALVARHGAERAGAVLDAAGRAATLVPDVDALLASGRPAGAIVVNAAMAHAGTALRLLEAGVPVLVEKPAAVDPDDAAAMAAAARRHGVALLPALSYLHCAYLDAFAQCVRDAGQEPAALALDWADPASETRHGEQKAYDRGIGLALDVVPHAWAILAGVLGRPAMVLEDCRIARGGRRVALRMRAGAAQCEVLLEREAPQRRRRLAVAGGPAIDFAEEPGILFTAAGARNADPAWATRADRPLRRQLEAFLRALPAPPAARDLADLEDSVRLAHACDLAVKEQQRRVLADAPAGEPDADTACALQELLAPRLVRLGRLRPGDREGLEREVAALRARVADRPAARWLQALAEFAP